MLPSFVTDSSICKVKKIAEIVDKGYWHLMAGRVPVFRFCKVFY